MKAHWMGRGQGRDSRTVRDGNGWRRGTGRGVGFEALESRCLLSASAVGSVGIAKSRDGSEIDGAGKGAIIFTVTRSGGDLKQPLVVNYAADASSTATAGANYVAPSGTVTIAAGQKKALITIPVMNDGVADPTQTLTLDVATDAGYTVVTKLAAATAKIADGAPTVSIARKRDGSDVNGDTTGAALYTVTRAGKDLSQDLTVYYTVDAASTAADTDDYETPSGSVVIPAGQKAATIDIAVNQVTTMATLTKTLVLDLTADPTYHLNAKPAADTATAKVKDAPAVDVFNMLGFEGPNSNWAYDARSGNATGTTTVSVSGNGSGYSYDHTLTSGASSAAVMQSSQSTLTPKTWHNSSTSEMNINWSQDSGELYLDSVEESAQGVDLSITCDALQFSGGILSGKASGSSTATATINGADGELDGNVKDTTTLGAVKNVSVLGTNTPAILITWAFSFNLSGTITDSVGPQQISTKGTDTWTFWAVPGVGVVKMTFTNNESGRSSRSGSYSINQTVTEVLTSYS